MQMIVIGMHRSGTSVLARLLNLMGVYFGPEGIGTGASQENQKGFWERRDVRALNDFVLQSAGHDWNRVSHLDVEALPDPVVEEFTRRASQIVLSMDAHRPWMIKEPRLCLLMPLWRRVLEVPVCVHILRHPVEVAASLQTRNQIPIEAGLALWEHYNRSGRAAMRGLPSVTVRHGDLLARPVEETARLFHALEALGVRGLTLPAAAEIESFVDPKLYRERKEKPELAAYASAPQVKLFERWKDSDRVEEGDFRGLPTKERKVLAGYEASLPPLGAPAAPKDLSPVGKSEYESVRKETAKLADQVRRLGEVCSEVKTSWRDEVARLVEHERELKDRNQAMEAELERLRDLLGQAEKRAAEQAIEIAGFSVLQGQLQQEKQSFEGEIGRLRILRSGPRIPGAGVPGLRAAGAGARGRPPGRERRRSRTSDEASAFLRACGCRQRMAGGGTGPAPVPGYRGPGAARMNRPGWNPDAVRRFLEASAILDADWYAARYGLGQAGPEECIRDYLEQGAARGRVPNARFETLEQGAGDPLAFAGATQSSASADISALRNLVQAAGAFDSDLYLEANPDVRAARINPLRHFLEYGWKELRNPSAGFDVWWYWSNWLDPRSELVNPLLHYLVSGAARGLQTTPSRPAGWSEGARLSPGSRRICLFAGYDPDGVVDDYVVRYVRELSRHADVYYLADCAMAAGELERLGPWVKGAWAERHGTYDFGSWSRLARELVGWDVIDGYDELLLANDSCYPVRPLDQVFAKMDATPCDWWGLQLTKRSFTEENSGDSPFPTVDQAVTGPLGDHTHALLDSLHVSSYFVAFRRPVASDPGFRRCIEAVVAQDRKLSIVTKYEIGTCQYLLSCGFRLSTFVDHLYPFHPAYTARVFDLIGDGFPLFKRFMLTDNTRNVANLAQWKERILAVAPDAPVEEMERNLLRVADADKLERSFSISEGPDGKPLVPKLLSASEMAQADARTPKFDHWWAFPVCAFDHLLTGNERAVFEQVRDDPSIRKIVLTRKRRIRLEGENVVVCPLESPQGQYCLLRAKQIFVKHSPSINARYPLSAKLHNFINLWHGIPLKRFGPASLDMQDHLEQVYRENRACRAVISSSKVDAMAMSAAFYPLPYRDVWITGLPRNDFIACPEERLPADFREEGLRLEAELAGRRLVLFAPTFKNAQADGYYRFGEEEIAWLRAWLGSRNAVLGVREHMADSANAYRAQLSSLGALDLSAKRYPNIEVLYRQASMLVTDYSSCAIDFMLTGRPMISFAYDFEHYAGTERGLFYDLDHVFPGPVCRDFAQLARALEASADADSDVTARAWRLRLFFDHADDASAWRLVQRVRNLYAPRELAATPIKEHAA